MSSKWLVCALACLIPGGGHFMQRRPDKGLVFFIAIPLMFGIGLWLSGRLFPLEWNDPLVFLGAIADRGVGLPYVVARMMEAGAGTVTDQSYEYGNTFLMTAGLLNFLVILYAFFVSVVFAVLMKDDRREQVKTAAMMLGAFVAVAYVLGWLMFPFPL